MTDKVNHFLVEGETERKFLEFLEINGRVTLFNMWKNPLRKILAKIRKQSCLYIIYDADRQFDNKETQNFLENFELLKTNCLSVTLLQQTRNFEDELCRALSIKKRDLFSLFRAKGKEEFKKHFLSDRNLISKLDIGNNFDLTKLWNQEIRRDLEQLQEHKGDYRDIEGLIRINISTKKAKSKKRIKKTTKIHHLADTRTK